MKLGLFIFSRGYFIYSINIIVSKMKFIKLQFIIGVYTYQHTTCNTYGKTNNIDKRKCFMPPDIP